MEVADADLINGKNVSVENRFKITIINTNKHTDMIVQKLRK